MIRCPPGLRRLLPAILAALLAASCGPAVEPPPAATPAGGVSRAGSSHLLSLASGALAETCLEGLAVSGRPVWNMRRGPGVLVHDLRIPGTTDLMGYEYEESRGMVTSVGSDPAVCGVSVDAPDREAFIAQLGRPPFSTSGLENAGPPRIRPDGTWERPFSVTRRGVAIYVLAAHRPATEARPPRGSFWAGRTYDWEPRPPLP